jgi:pimeloyl-ACP methyl ester carboxylesterase
MEMTIRGAVLSCVLLACAPPAKPLKPFDGVTVQAAPTAVDPTNFDGLDVALFWYGPDNQSQRAVRGQPNRFFDAQKSTVLYVHGWQPGTTSLRSRESMNRMTLNELPDIAAAWFAAGWNVGIFYWNQLADEDEVKDAEAKIHSTQGPQGMRWRDASGDYSVGPADPVYRLMVARVLDAMSQYQGAEFRVVGHSLGSQLAIRFAHEMWRLGGQKAVPSTLVPKRVALLDPAFLKSPRPYLEGRWTGEVARALVDETRREIAYEMYRTSPATSNLIVGDDNAGLTTMGTFSELKPYALGGPLEVAIDVIRDKHNYAIGWYFESLSSKLLAKCPDGKTLEAPGAGMASGSLWSLAARQGRFVQADSVATTTKTALDDIFEADGDGCL